MWGVDAVTSGLNVLQKLFTNFTGEGNGYCMSACVRACVNMVTCGVNVLQKLLTYFTGEADGYCVRVAWTW